MNAIRGNRPKVYHMADWGKKHMPRPAREPTVSLQEAADKFGLSVNGLAGLMRKYPDGVPVPGLICKTPQATERKRYHMSDFKRWWTSIQPKKESA